MEFKIETPIALLVLRTFDMRAFEGGGVWRSVFSRLKTSRINRMIA